MSHVIGLELLVSYSIGSIKRLVDYLVDKDSIGLMDRETRLSLRDELISSEIRSTGGWTILT